MAHYRGGKHTSLPDGTPRWARFLANAEGSNRFLMPDGAVRWLAEGSQLPFAGAFAMAGHRAHFDVYYLVDADGTVQYAKHCAYPFLTSRGYAFRYDLSPVLTADGSPLAEVVEYVETKGSLRVVCGASGHRVERTFYPAVQSLGLVERITFVNAATHAVDVRISLPNVGRVQTKGVDVPVASGLTLADESGRMLTDLVEDTTRLVPPDGQAVFYVVYWSKVRAEDHMVDCRLEFKKRAEQVAEAFADTLTLITPDTLLNRAFAHALLCGSEHLADTPLGVLPYTDEVDVRAAAEAMDMLAMCGVHRAGEAVRAFIEAMEGQADAIPAWLDNAGRPVGVDLPIYYALALAHQALLTGAHYAATHYAAVESVVDAGRRTFKKGLYSPHGIADLSTQCAFYALLTEASSLAFALDDTAKGKLWLEASRQLANRIEAAFGARAGEASTYGKRVTYALADALYYGVDARADDTAKALIALWLNTAVDPKRAPTQAQTLRLASGLLRQGYTDAAIAMLGHLSTEALYGAASPYPGDSRVAWAYCRTLVYGLVGLQPLSFERLGFTLHLPRKWHSFALRGLRVGDNVLNLEWQDGHLVIRTIFEQTLYDGDAAVGQPIMVELPR